MKLISKISLCCISVCFSCSAWALYVPGTGFVPVGAYSQARFPNYTNANQVGPGLPNLMTPNVPALATVPQVSGYGVPVASTTVGTSQSTATIVNPPNTVIDLPPASAPGLEPNSAQIIPTPIAADESVIRQAVLPRATTLTQSNNVAVIPPASLNPVIKAKCDPFRCQCNDVRSQLVLSSTVEAPSEVNEPPRGRFIRSLKQVPTISYSDELPGPPDLLLLQ